MRRIGRSLDKYGEFARDEQELLKQVIRPGDVVVDAGAMYGQTSLGLSKVCLRNMETCFVSRVFVSRRMGVLMQAYSRIHAKYRSAEAALENHISCFANKRRNTCSEDCCHLECVWAYVCMGLRTCVCIAYLPNHVLDAACR